MTLRDLLRKCQTFAEHKPEYLDQQIVVAMPDDPAAIYATDDLVCASSWSAADNIHKSHVEIRVS